MKARALEHDGFKFFRRIIIDILKSPKVFQRHILSINEEDAGVDGEEKDMKDPGPGPKPRSKRGPTARAKIHRVILLAAAFLIFLGDGWKGPIVGHGRCVGEKKVKIPLPLSY